MGKLYFSILFSLTITSHLSAAPAVPVRGILQGWASSVEAPIVWENGGGDGEESFVDAAAVWRAGLSITGWLELPLADSDLLRAAEGVLRYFNELHYGAGELIYSGEVWSLEFNFRGAVHFMWLWIQDGDEVRGPMRFSYVILYFPGDNWGGWTE